MVVRAAEAPRSGREIDATLCWLGEAHSVPRGRYLLKHTTSTVRAVLDTIHHTLEVEQLTERPDADSLSRNEIGRVTLRTSAELYFDRYADNRTTGSFILIDEATNETVGAGMIDDGR
jgi:sulfate adenylyltransferase subunit 1 (EFTu-like GTPase family)